MSVAHDNATCLFLSSLVACYFVSLYASLIIRYCTCFAAVSDALGCLTSIISSSALVILIVHVEKRSDINIRTSFHPVLFRVRAAFFKFFVEFSTFLFFFQTLYLPKAIFFNFVVYIFQHVGVVGFDSSPVTCVVFVNEFFFSQVFLFRY